MDIKQALIDFAGEEGKALLNELKTHAQVEVEYLKSREPIVAGFLTDLAKGLITPEAFQNSMNNELILLQARLLEEQVTAKKAAMNTEAKVFQVLIDIAVKIAATA